MRRLLQLPSELIGHAASFLRLEEILAFIATWPSWLFIATADIWPGMRHQLRQEALRVSAYALQRLNIIYRITAADLGINDLQQCNVLCAACDVGDHDKVQWLTQRYQLRNEVVRCASVFAADRPNILQILLDTQTLDQQRVIIQELVWPAARRGHTRTLTYLANMMRCVQPMGLFMAFQTVCASGWESAAAFAIGANISGHEVRVAESAFLGQACLSGQFSTAAWLIMAFNITNEDLARNNYTTLRNVGLRRPIIASWLVAKLGISPRQLYSAGLGYLSEHSKKRRQANTSICRRYRSGHMAAAAARVRGGRLRT